MQQPDPNTQLSTNRLHGLVVEVGTASILKSKFEVKTLHEVDLDMTVDLKFHLTNPKGVWTRDLSRNKQAWLEREIILWVLSSKLKLESVNIKKGNDQSLAELESRIYQILLANTDDFFRLARILNRSLTEDLAGADLRHTLICSGNLSKANLQTTNLQEADLSGSNLSEADLQEANLQNAYLILTNLNGANLTQATLQHAYLNGANLRNAKLQSADLSFSSLAGVYLIRANLERANLSHADLNGAFLNYSHLVRANCSHADLSEANLSGADLSSANLSRVNLSKSNLNGANLNGANLAIANLAETNLTGAKVQNTILKGCLGVTPEQKLKLEQRGAIFSV
jgi:uncharacterized protein YjbI with pentapeptide repeats